MRAILSVTKDLVCVRRASYLVCSYVLRTAEGCYAIDAGMDSEGEDMTAGLAALGASVADLRGILLTHWHNDHAAGAAALAAASGAPVYYQAVEQPWFTGAMGTGGLLGRVADAIPEAGLLVLFKGLLGNSLPRPVSATTLVADGARLPGGFRAIATPGHTPGHCAYVHEPTGALFTGDALAVVHGRVRLMARPVTPDLATARRSALRLLQENPRALCPGHREPLVANLDREWEEMRRRMADERPWPLFG